MLQKYKLITFTIVTETVVIKNGRILVMFNVVLNVIQYRFDVLFCPVKAQHINGVLNLKRLDSLRVVIC